jgi:hypothetical protein
MRISISFYTALFALLCATPAWALDKIYSPYVEPGELSLEYSGNRTFDKAPDKNNIQEHQFAVEYGATSRWETEFYANFGKEPDASFKMSSVEWENRFQLSEQGQYWVDPGLLVSYAHAIDKGDPDSLEIKLLLAKDVGRFTNIANVGFSQDLGPHAAGGPDYAFLWSTRYRYSEQVQPGFEIQSGLGQDSALRHFSQQEHYIGPALYGRLFGHVKYEAAWLAGVSDASATSAARALVEYEMHF